MARLPRFASRLGLHVKLRSGKGVVRIATLCQRRCDLREAQGLENSSRVLLADDDSKDNSFSPPLTFPIR